MKIHKPSLAEITSKARKNQTRYKDPQKSRVLTTTIHDAAHIDDETFDVIRERTYLALEDILWDLELYKGQRNYPGATDED